MSDTETDGTVRRDGGASDGSGSSGVVVGRDDAAASDPESTGDPEPADTDSPLVPWTWRTLALVGAAVWLGSALVVMQAARWLGYADGGTGTSVLAASQVVALVVTVLTVRYLRSLD